MEPKNSILQYFVDETMGPLEALEDPAFVDEAKEKQIKDVLADANPAERFYGFKLSALLLIDGAAENFNEWDSHLVINALTSTLNYLVYGRKKENEEILDEACLTTTPPSEQGETEGNGDE
jgi:hypothetical protein